MGYFSVPENDTPRAKIKCAAENLQLLLRGGDDSLKDYVYLLDFAQGYIEIAREALLKKDEST